MARGALPTGTVTFLFTDVEGSTRLAEELGDAWPALLARHHHLLRASWTAHDGVEVSTEGDSFFVVFETVARAVAAAVQAQRDLAGEPWPTGVELRVRMGLHTGDGRLGAGSYVGLDVHRAARIAAAGHGGQVLLSASTHALLEGSANWPQGVSVRDLGEHLFKDLSRPERVHELLITGLSSHFPPIRTLTAARINLPSQLTTFLGRHQELDDTRRLLADTRLLTLLGPGGTGKTRLALQTAATSADAYPDGITFVALGMVDDPALVLPTIAQALGLQQVGVSQMDRLVAFLGEKRFLLILDNFEQVIDAAAIVGDLIGRAPHLSVLVTSRSPLRVYGEREYQVPPLGVPDPRQVAAPEDIAGCDAVALFVDRAQHVHPDFVLGADNARAVAEICARLDGLPLAIELAAARVRALSPQAIAQRLDHRLALLSGGSHNLPPRQQTLNGAIAWSHDLLNERDRRFFARFSVFAGGAELPAVEGVVCEPGEADSALDDIESLLDKSLLRRTSVNPSAEPRYGMLETIREFAVARLADRGEADLVRQRQATWVANFVERESAAVLGQERRQILDRYEVEHDNIRAALTWALDANWADIAMRIFTGTWRFWQARGFVTEARRHAERVLALPSCDEHPTQRLAAIEAAAGIAYWQGDVPTSRRWYSEALLIAREIGDTATVANALYNVTFPLSQDPATFGEARTAANEAIRLYRSVRDEQGVGRVLWGLASGLYFQGNTEEGLELAKQALTILEGSDDLFMRAWAHYMVGVLSLDADAEAMRRHLVVAYRLFREANDTSGHLLVFDAFATLAWRDGDPEQAMRLAGFVGNIERATGTGLAKMNRDQAGFFPEILAQDPALAAVFEEGRQLTLEQVTHLAIPDP